MIKMNLEKDKYIIVEVIPTHCSNISIKIRGTKVIRQI